MTTYIYISSKFLVLFIFIILNGCAAKPDYRDPVANIPMVFVKGGTYMMGSDARIDEQPIHEVTVPDLFVGIYEVTFKQYDAYCKATNCEPPSDEGWGRSNRPVINVSWNDANAYAAWLSEQTGHQYRLPTEAEWEYFTRAGTTTRYWSGDKPPKGKANCSDCNTKWANRMTAPVGSFSPNPWGIYDTIGNVIEWVHDDYTKGYGDPSIKSSADKNQRKGQRGGAWSYLARDSRSSSRDYRKVHMQTDDAGFRLILEPTDQLLLNTKK